MGAPRRLLVNFVYCNPVGHSIEALHYCHGYHLADPDIDIAVALSADTAFELASLCPFIRATYPVGIDVFDAEVPPAGLDAIPLGWDWVAIDGRGHQPDQRALFPGIAAYYDRADERFAASGSAIGMAGAAPPAYVRGGEFRLTLPAESRQRAARALERAGSASPRIAVLPAGSAPRSFYPSLQSWKMIVSSLLTRWPDAQICLVGKLRRDGKTSTAFERGELDELLAFSSAVDAVDLGIVDQLAIVAACDVLVSPHSGFAMAGLAVGTPWLSIAGNRWPEYYFNGVPFYSVLPEVGRYPALHGFDPDPAPVEDDGPRSPSMSFRRIKDDLDEIIEGAALLIERRWPYETAMADHFRRMLALRQGRNDLIWSIDGVHLRYVGTTPPPQVGSDPGGVA